jgi:hypothetical protein
MASKKEKNAVSNNPIITLIADPNHPYDRRAGVLKAVLMDESPEMQATVAGILEALANTQAEAVYHEKNKVLDEKLAAMEKGPLRLGVFLSVHKRNGDIPRARVKLQDGSVTFPVIAQDDVLDTVQRGDMLLLDAQVSTVLHVLPQEPSTGEVAVLERRLGKQVVVRMRGEEHVVYDAGQELLSKLDSGDVALGSDILVVPRMEFAFAALPRQEGVSHYRFLSTERVPNISVERDIGAPPRFIEDVAKMVWVEMTNPGLRRAYRLRRCIMKLLAGVSGSGKTLSLQALWRRIYEMMSQHCEIPIEKLPPRVFRIRASALLSKWFGESERLMALALQEIEQLAAQPFLTPDGREVLLPVLVIIEEIDGLSRSRGEDAIYDRVMTTLLQLLDPTRPELQDKLIIFVGTTNVEALVDLAMLRRIGGTVERFNRLERKPFESVLSKHLRDLPLASTNGDNQDTIRKHMINELTAWLYSPNAADNTPVVELTYAGTANAAPFYRKDFLTGATVDRAVQQAASAACDVELLTNKRVGVTAAMIMRALDEQVHSSVKQLNEHNARQYLTLPEGVRVVTVRRLPTAPIRAYEVQQAPDHHH